MNEIRILLEKEANEIEDRLEDLINGYEKGTVDKIIEQQQRDLELIDRLLKVINDYNEVNHGNK